MGWRYVGCDMSGKDTMTKRDELKKALLKTAVKKGGKPTVTCKKVLLLAGKFDVTPLQVGRMCDKEGIKIRECMMGCF